MTDTPPASPVSLVPADGCALWGMYSAPAPGPKLDNAGRLAHFADRERLVRPGFNSPAATRAVDIAQWFFRFHDDATFVDKSGVGLLAATATAGRIPMATWVGVHPLGGDLIPALSTPDHPRYKDLTALIRRQARHLAGLGVPVMVRLFHEMNGDWSTWCASSYGRETWRFRVAWRRIVDLFREQGATNVVWVWCPNAGSHPDAGWNSKWEYWPGDAYVDWVGVDGYSWGDLDWRGVWADVLDDVVQPHPHAADDRSHSGAQPVIICETASAPEVRVRYVTDAFTDLRARRQVRGVMWFDQPKERAWHVDAVADSGLALLELQRWANHPCFNPRYAGPDAVAARAVDPGEGGQPYP